MAKLRTSITSKGQTTVPKAIRNALGVRPLDNVYWEAADGVVRVTAGEPEFFRWFGAIHVGRGSVSGDIARARKLRGLRTT
ncbi:MAG TPA: AbrB family transcriptional regulator [Thermoanaerobaculia bacterium]|nr:AbrB family transcriptional regulator [Thermoanaerobaculia bacterium]